MFGRQELRDAHEINGAKDNNILARSEAQFFEGLEKGVIQNKDAYRSALKCGRFVHRALLSPRACLTQFTSHMDSMRFSAPPLEKKFRAVHFRIFSNNYAIIYLLLVRLSYVE